MVGLTFVLVHGAWHGGWCWSRVANRLRAAEHRVFMPTCTGLGERAHLLSRNITLDTFIADVTGLIEAEELDDIVLVGHSFGGLIVSGVADRMPERIRHLVYLDAALVQPGACAFDALPSAIVAARREAAEASSGGLSLPCPPPSAFGVLDVADAAWLTRRLTPHPLSTFVSPLSIRNALGNGVARTYVACTAPVYLPLDGVKVWVQAQPDWGWREMAAGHDAMVSAPDIVARLLIELAVAWDGSRASNRRVPMEILGGLDGDQPARDLIEQQEAEIAQKAGRPPRAIQSLTRAAMPEPKLARD